MCKTVKVIFLSIYLAILFHCIHYLLFVDHNEFVMLTYLVKRTRNDRKLERELKKLKNSSTVMTFDFKRPKRFPTDLIYILEWIDESTFRVPTFDKGQQTFIKNNCTYTNCYITTDRRLLLDIRYFDAMLFDFESGWEKLPIMRAEFQKYIFATSNPSSISPLCNEKYENYFNLTWTYRLTSDLIRPKFKITDVKGNVIGPKIGIKWTSQMSPTSDQVKNKLAEKKKAAAWFINSCNTDISFYRNMLSSLNDSLSKANFSIDVYRLCGKLTCNRNHIDECLFLLQKDYYFYLSFEDIVDEDYVSEQLLYPLLNYAVPVVFGGADYSRFLPPGSYIDATKSELDIIALPMINAIKNIKTYYDYFRWHNHYTYKKVSPGEDFCDLCEYLNNPYQDRREITSIRQWWNPNHKEACKLM